MTTDPVSLLIDLLLYGLRGGGMSPVPTLGLASASFYFGFTEEEPTPADQIYLLLAAINASQQQLRDDVVQNWLDGRAPLTVEQFHARASSVVPNGDPGAALLICHNVLRAFARGSRAVYWHRVEDWLDQKREAEPAFAIPSQTFVAPILDSVGQPLRARWMGDNLNSGGPPLADATGSPSAEAAPQPNDYTDGAGHFYRPLIVNPGAGGQLIKWAGRESIFWLLFDPREPLGTADPGDWYQFFLTATAAYYAAEKRAVLVLDEPLSFMRQRVRLTATLGRIVQAFMEGVERYEGKDDISLAAVAAAYPERLGWLWANALSFIEGGLYGQSYSMTASEAQEDAVRESLAHREGALFGLSLSLGGKKKVPTWTWYIPRVNALLREVAKHLALPAAGDLLGAHPIDNAQRRMGALAQFVTDHSEEFGPFIADLAREGPGLGDIKAHPNLVHPNQKP